jgi:hypothetical protein
LTPFLAISFLLACDPGRAYRPVGWHQADGRFSTSVDGLELSTRSSVALDGQRGWSLEFWILNRSENQAFLERARLETDAGTSIFEPPAGKEEFWTIAPGQERRINLFFDTEDRLADFLKDTVKVDMEVRHGDRVLHIPVLLQP